MTTPCLRGLLPFLVALPLSAFPLSTTHGAEKKPEPARPDCKQCHTCEKPVASRMCLKPCPTLGAPHESADHRLKEAPDTIVLDEIAKLYQPVTFNHRLHARMAGMGGDCATCHHYSPPGRIPPCSECHAAKGRPASLRQPGLKGAYHRQCLGCHREWSHDTRCVVCHLPAGEKRVAGNGNGHDGTDIMGIPHPRIPEPVTKVYQTPHTPAPVVTFHHKDHVELYGIKCVGCHKQETCGSCHDLKKNAPRKTRTDVEVHAMCNDCHKDQKCDTCHSTKERPAFSHDVTGWPLSRAHTGLGCRACHPTGKPIAKLNRDCAGCHAGWNADNFRHAVTGLTLDETHASADCTDCHAGKRFAEKPTCTGCHDDKRTHKDKPPGTYAR
jgi:hypothetical protein